MKELIRLEWIFLTLMWLGPGQAVGFGERRPINTGPANNVRLQNTVVGAGTASGPNLDQNVKKPRHWYSLQLDVACQVVKLIEDPEQSSAVLPIYDLVYLATGAGAGQVRRIQDIGANLADPKNVQASTRVVAEGISTPNDVGVLPDNSIADMTANVWWIASGSVSKSNRDEAGEIYMLDMTKPTYKPLQIVSSPGFGYTAVHWVDMDLDKNADALAIRTTKTSSQLVWLQQPPSNSPWPLSVIDDDVGGQTFKTMWIKDKEDDRMLIISAGSQDGMLSIYWVNDPDNDWTRTKHIQKSVIGKDGSYVNIEIVDVNGDGRLDVLTSVTGMRGQPGKVICYETPENVPFNKGNWRKHVLSDEFEPSTNYRRISPGGVYAFYPGKSETEKPSILVSGADDGKLYVLKPKSWSQYIWHYSTTVIFEQEGRIGVPAAKDVDGDGNVEIFVPESRYIHVLTYQGTEDPTDLEDDRDGSSHTIATSFLTVVLSICLML